MQKMSERNLFKDLMEGVDDVAEEREVYSSIKRGLIEAVEAANQGSFVQGLEHSPICFYESDAIQGVIDKLEGDMERYYLLKEYIKKELEDATPNL